MPRDPLGPSGLLLPGGAPDVRAGLCYTPRACEHLRQPASFTEYYTPESQEHGWSDWWSKYSTPFWVSPPAQINPKRPGPACAPAATLSYARRNVVRPFVARI